MKKRALGRTGLEVSEIGFGGWAIGGNSYGNVRDEDSLEALETAWAGGVNFYDTADVYGEGHSETLLGKFFKGKPRNEILIATKAGWNFYSDAPGSGPVRGGHQRNFDPAYIRFACEQSLKRFGIDTIDLFQLHNPSVEQIRSGEVTDTLEALKKEGKIRFLGISVHTEAEALAALEDPRFDTLQIIFNLLDQRMADKVFPAAQKKNIGLLAREPLASGLLTGKYPPSHSFPKNDHRRRWVAAKRNADWQKIRRLQEALKDKEIRLQQAALEYILNFNAVSSVIPGAKTRAQVLENLQASVAPALTVNGLSELTRLYHNEAIFKEGLIPR